MSNIAHKCLKNQPFSGTPSHGLLNATRSTTLVGTFDSFVHIKRFACEPESSPSWLLQPYRKVLSGLAGKVQSEIVARFRFALHYPTIKGKLTNQICLVHPINQSHAY